jgi:hypothetical protein
MQVEAEEELAAGGGGWRGDVVWLCHSTAGLAHALWIIMAQIRGAV